MRGVAFALLACSSIAVAVAAAACSEHFPEYPPSPSDGGTFTATDGGPLESAPPAVIDPTKRVNASSSPVVFDPVRGGVWTANGDVGTVSYVDPDGRSLVGEIPFGATTSAALVSQGLGADMTSVCLSPDGAWLAAVDRNGGTVSLIDPDARAVRRTLSVGSHPRACVWDAADPRWLYVAVEDDAVVAVVDRTAGVVATTIAVPRLPSGLAASSAQSQIYVTHRIDGDVTYIDTGKRAIVAEVSLADEPYSGITVPNGKPFAFESLTLTANGRRAWIPHELLAPTHPIVFDETVFPAISVVDLFLNTEVQSDPNSANIDGRKNLFDAIDLIGPDGQPDVFAQLCSVAMHPNGFIAWALACGSEDLLVFDVNSGAATDVVRGLPGDHPVGMTLDDTGQRIFVLSDQSHTLSTFDTDGGDLIGETRAYGAPIPTVGHDPVDPGLRAGLTLFFRANPSKGTLTTTKDDWLSCAGCHLDGFGSTNLRLFEARPPDDPSTDAQIGHAGLTDFFTTVATAASSPSTFDPHDLLTAVAEQGGLVPVVDGGAPVDPGAPTPEATALAQSLATVVTRDLPAQPAWTRQDPTTLPNTAWDAEYCGNCHQAEYAAWKTSVHAHAGEDPMMLACNRTEQGIVHGAGISRLCVGCHDPVGARTGDFTFQAKRGVTCIGCHDVEQSLQAGGNGALRSVGHDWSADHKAWATASLQTLRQPTFCEGCHQQFVPGTGLTAIDTIDEYNAGPYAGQALCVDCHMPRGGGVSDHHAAGGNFYLGQLFGDSTLVQEQNEHIDSVLSVSAQKVSGGVVVTLRNVGAGHDFPTGVTDIRQPWVQIEVQGGDGGVAQVYGGVDATGLLSAGAARLGMDIAAADGTPLLLHQLTAAARVPYDVRIPPGEAQSVFVATPELTGPADAVVYYGVVRAPFYRDAVGDAGATAPAAEIARAPVR